MRKKHGQGKRGENENSAKDVLGTRKERVMGLQYLLPEGELYICTGVQGINHCSHPSSLCVIKISPGLTS